MRYLDEQECHTCYLQYWATVDFFTWNGMGVSYITSSFT